MCVGEARVGIAVGWNSLPVQQVVHARGGGGLFPEGRVRVQDGTCWKGVVGHW